MISKIQAKDFKGQTFDQELAKLNIVIAPNGAGKTSRTDCLQLLLNGYIMNVGKRNSDIFEAISAQGNLKAFCGCTIVGPDGKSTKFLKRYSKAEETGAISLAIHVRDTKSSAANYSAAMGVCGAPKIVDVGVFMGLSPTKQIEELFSLYPPDGDLTKISTQIDEAREALNIKKKSKLDQEALLGTMVRAVSEIALGTGTLADLEAEEKATEQELDNAKAELASQKAAAEAERMIEKAKADHAEQMRKLNEQAEAEADAKYKALIKHTEKINAENDAKRAEEEKAIEAQKYRDQAALLAKAKADKEIAAQQAAREAAIVAAENRLRGMAAKSGVAIEAVSEPEPVKPPDNYAAVAAIGKIIGAMERAGCSECAAILVAKREKRNLHGGAI